MAELPVARYLRETKTDLATFAKWIGATEETVRLYANGKQAVPRERAVQISTVTGGRLTVAELLFPEGLPPGAKLVADDEGTRA